MPAAQTLIGNVVRHGQSATPHLSQETSMHMGRWLVGAALLCGSGMVSHPVRATTWYVRTDGGTAAQCTGKSDAAYRGHGRHEACAFDHPFWALQPGQRASNFEPAT